MITLTLDDSRLTGVKEFPQRLVWALQKAVARTAQEAARDMKGEMANQQLAATSLLINSVAAEAVDPLTWTVGPHVAYARYVLEGRKPGAALPPWRAIRDWMKVKRIGEDRRTAWAIARAIQKRGLRPRDFLTPVVARATDRLQVLGAAAVNDALGTP